LAIGVTLIAESAFVFLFGETWRQSGVIAVWLVPLFAMRFVASPLSYTFYIAGKQRVDLIWQCTLLIMTLLIFYFLINFEMIIRTYAIGYGCLYILYLVLSYRYSSISRLK
jgi:O-antigen/teichoic acid export membrane protein